MNGEPFRQQPNLLTSPPIHTVRQVDHLLVTQYFCTVPRKHLRRLGARQC